MSINRIRLEFKVLGKIFIVTDSVGVLIESDWNLKKTAEILKYEGKSRINRIRLEFKVCGGMKTAAGTNVLIESDWNLKTISIVSGMYWLPY